MSRILILLVATILTSCTHQPCDNVLARKMKAECWECDWKVKEIKVEKKDGHLLE